MTSKNRIIASLTTYGTRINTVHIAIETILNQTFKANKVILWLAEDEFQEKSIPESLKKLQNKGLELNFCEDIKSYKKLIPTLEKYPNDLIITFDDDIIYEKDIIEKLVDAYKKEPMVVHCARGHRIRFDKDNNVRSYNQWEHCSEVFKEGFEIFPTGAGGILYPPDCFDKEITNKNIFMTLAPHGDDIWFKAMTLRNGIKSKIISQKNKKYMDLKYIENTQENGLSLLNIDEINGNNKQINQVFNKYNLFDFLNKNGRMKTKRYCPICNTSTHKFSPYGVAMREDAMCPTCRSVEKDRLVWLYLIKQTNISSNPNIKMLHVAPEKIFQKIFQKLLKNNYISVDLHDKSAMIKMDITNIRFDDDSFDAIYCSHVLEHVVDDRKAMKELNRVLKKSGWAILNVPIVYNDKPTFEDFSIVDPIQRTKIFGQADHIRNYGTDYKDRLEGSGFKVKTIYPKDFLTQDDIELMRITPSAGEIYFCTK
ncbi:class I SAM-dependent methyltransferase [Arcobacter sp. F2176]|uniref:methyltransferase domain-containing protein n=1 Tax=Arcobacter sp. F2176 TaxID=2044511 RepID=UPI00100A8DF7|nr:class I SAM-dependent methyltransferase [Arcobacter sp. F2176]RXJ82199.1 hypothetical protein CRU95_01715 [Arcobacter sp. F2176]